jgi:hypothetical protein
MAARWVAKLSEPGVAERWGVSEGDRAKLGAAETAFAEALVRSRNPATHTPVQTALTKAAEEALQELMRFFKKVYFDPGLFAGKITEEEYLDLGLRLHDGKPTSHSVPATFPVITRLEAVGGCQVRAHFQDEKAGRSQAVLSGCNGCLLYYALGDEKQEDRTLLTQTQLLTVSPSLVQLPLSAQRKWFSVAGRWQLVKGGILGPFGPVEHIVVV